MYCVYMKDYIIRKIINKNNKKYEYYKVINDEINNKINNKIILNKIDKIYIPPAYIDVKIFLNKELLATGIDTAGRKQYIYSENRKKKRELKKYNQIYKLSKNIYKLKKKINKDLNHIDFDKNKLIALTLKIMDLCNFRGGNKKYEELYGTYGLTTIHKKHVKISKNEIIIEFIGKKGVNNNCIIKNKSLQKIIKNIYQISSKNDNYLFSIIYKNEKIGITILDLNKYLESFNVTCKDLRTWNANIIFLKNFKNEVDHLDNSYDSKDENKKLKLRKKIIRNAIKSTAISLHHTPVICKNSYIFKKIIEDIEKNDLVINKMRKKNIINYEKLLEDFLKKNYLE